MAKYVLNYGMPGRPQVAEFNSLRDALGAFRQITETKSVEEYSSPTAQIKFPDGTTVSAHGESRRYVETHLPERIEEFEGYFVTPTFYSDGPNYRG